MNENRAMVVNLETSKDAVCELTGRTIIKKGDNGDW